MILTEEEAKKKWCLLQNAIYVLIPKGTNCIASECMMWKWQKGEFLGYDGKTGETTYEYDDKLSGYCGLAK